MMQSVFQAINTNFPEEFIRCRAISLYNRLRDHIQKEGILPEKIDISRAIEMIRFRIRQLKENGYSKIALCPSGGITREILQLEDFSGCEVLLFDSFLCGSDVGGFPVYPPEMLTEFKVDCLVLTTGEYHHELLKTFHRTHQSGLNCEIFCPFFRDYEMVRLPDITTGEENDPAFVRSKVLSDCAKVIGEKRSVDLLMLGVMMRRETFDHPEWLEQYINFAPSEKAVKAVQIFNELYPEQLCNGKKVFVFTAFRFAFNYIKHAVSLRKKGYTVCLVAMESNINEASGLEDALPYFDTIITADGDWIDYAYMISRIHPSLIHTISLIRVNEFALLVGCLGNAPVVTEFNDITSHGYRPETLSDLMGDLPARHQFQMEEKVCSLSAGLVDKDDPKAISGLMERYGINKKTLTFSSYALPDFFSESPDTDPLRIAYAGGISTSDGLDASGPTTSIFGISEILIRQGINFGIYNAYDNGFVDAYRDYRNKAVSEPLLNYSACLHPKLLSQELAEYSFGWLAYDNSISEREAGFYHTASVSKFYTYIEAGLPVICSSYLHFHANMIRKYGIGVIIDVEDFTNLIDILAEVSVYELKENVLRYREMNNMESQIDRLISFYSDILAL